MQLFQVNPSLQILSCSYLFIFVDLVILSYSTGTLLIITALSLSLPWYFVSVNDDNPLPVHQLFDSLVIASGINENFEEYWGQIDDGSC